MILWCFQVDFANHKAGQCNLISYDAVRVDKCRDLGCVYCVGGLSERVAVNVDKKMPGNLVCALCYFLFLPRSYEIFSKILILCCVVSIVLM